MQDGGPRYGPASLRRGGLRLLGGRRDFQKTADACGLTWRSSSDALPGTAHDYSDMYQVLRDWGCNVVRVPISWNSLEPVAPVWSPSLKRYVHTWNSAYLRDLKTMVSGARAHGLDVLLDMHQDYWSPALHNITNWDGSRGYCEGVGMPRWLSPSIDAKASTTQNVDVDNGMNWFFRNVHDPKATVTRASPWALMYSAWDQVAYQFSPRSGLQQRRPRRPGDADDDRPPGRSRSTSASSPASRTASTRGSSRTPTWARRGSSSPGPSRTTSAGPSGRT